MYNKMYFSVNLRNKIHLIIFQQKNVFYKPILSNTCLELFTTQSSKLQTITIQLHPSIFNTTTLISIKISPANRSI